MDPYMWAQYQKNAETFRQRIDDICEKYANVEDPGFDLCLETMTYKTREGAIPAEGVEARRALASLQNHAEENMETMKNLSNTEDTWVTHGNEDEEVQENHAHYVPGSIKESFPGQSLLEASRVSSSLLTLPEEQDPELEHTFSSQSDTSTLQDLYPSMLTKIHEACQRQQVSNAASSLRRKYQRQRWKVKRLNPGQSFMNSSGVSSSTTSQAPSVAPKACTDAHVHTPNSRDAGSGQTSSPWKCATSQGTIGRGPVRVIDLSTPPSSGPSSPSDVTPDLDQTYMVRASPPLPDISQRSEKQVRKQQINQVKSLYCHAGASSLASQPVTDLRDAEDHAQLFPLPKRRNYEGCIHSPSKVNSPLKSPSHRHHNRLVLMEYSPPRQEVELSSPRRSPQHGLLDKRFSATGSRKALWTSPMKSHPKTQCPVSPQQQTSKARVRQPELSSLSAKTAQSCHSQGSPRKHSFIHSPHSALTSGTRISSLPRHPEIYTSPSHRHRHPTDIQENLRPSPSMLEALRMRRRSFSGPQDGEHGPTRRLSSSIRYVNQQFRQLYHQHICQRRSSLSCNSSSCCLCEQRAEGYSQNSRASSITTTPASATNSRLAALSLTPVRRRRFQSGLSPLLKRLQRSRQVGSSLLQNQHHQGSRQQQKQALYSGDECEMSDESQSPDLHHGAQIGSGSHHHHHHYPAGSSSYYPSATLAAMGLASPHARLSKRRCLSEPKESPSLKRFRESAKAFNTAKLHGFPQHQHHHQQWEGDEDEDDGGEEMMVPARNGFSEEHRTRSRALLLQCPSPRFLRAAMRRMKADSSRTRSPHASAWRGQQDRMHDAEGMSEEAWNESGLSPSILCTRKHQGPSSTGNKALKLRYLHLSLSRRRLLYSVPPY